MTVKFPQTFGSDCRGCGRYVKQTMPNLNPEQNNQGIRLACSQCSTTYGLHLKRMNKAREFYIPTGNRRTHYHTSEDCYQLKRADDTMPKTWDIIKRMTLKPCPICVSEE